MDKEKRRKLKEEYSARKVIGGVYAFRNTLNGKMLLLSTSDMPGSQNRFTFAQQMGGCIHPKLRNDWGKNGTDFCLDVLEELVKKEDQTDKEFAQDVEALFEMTLEKYSSEQLY